MADIATVLKKTIDGLPANTPAIRQKVYDKARATILAKLQARDPQPSQAAIDRQMEQVEKLIAAVESGYTFREEIDSVFTDATTDEPEAAVERPRAEAPKDEIPPLAAPSEPSPMEAEPEHAEPGLVTSGTRPAVAQPATAESATDEVLPEAAEAVSAPSPLVDVPASPAGRDTSEAVEPPAERPQVSVVPASSAHDTDDASKAGPTGTPAEADAEVRPVAPVETPKGVGGPEKAPAETARPVSWGYMDSEPDITLREREAADAPLPGMPRSKAKKGGFKGLAIAIVVLLLLGAGGYAAWLNKDQIMALLPADLGQEVNATQPAEEEEPAAGQENSRQEAAAPTETAPPGPTQGQAPKAKFTQRLQPDGTETDPGPAGGGRSLGEGTSVAQVTEPPQEATAQVPSETAETAQDAPEQSNRSEQPSVAVGQRAIFYEERTAVEQGTADQGNVVWSQVEESPGGDAPAEPAIRADVAFPERDLNLRITIRRNGDATLPASHIIELVFVTPDDFPGGVIDDVLRITFKDNEQSPGTPLLGIPAKIADNFFLVALTDGEQEIAANLRLMGNRPWIDIPVIYRTGRRALITMEKGLSGEAVFGDVIDAWAAAGEATGG